ncbi:MAG: hypothetical protein RLZZ127_157, partial [Planctomycetota bacterium]
MALSYVLNNGYSFGPMLPNGKIVQYGALDGSLSLIDLSYPVGWTDPAQDPEGSGYSALSGAVVGSGPLAVWTGVPASVTYDPPAGTRLPVGATTVRAVVTPQDATLPRLETVFRPTIGSRSIVVQVPDVTVMYGDPVPTPTLVAGGDGLAPQDTWASLATPPVLTMPTQRDAGSYAIGWGSLPQDPNYAFTGAVSDSPPATLTILPATAGVSVSGLSVVANGQRRPVQVATVPAGLPVQITYNGQTQAPSAPGTYAVVATVSHRNYHGRAEDVLVIAANTPPKVSAGPFQRIPVG